MKPLPWPVILASASPRRHELLKQLIPEFEIITADVDEEAMIEPDPFVTAQKLAKEKALVVSADHPDSMVIAGDTVVALPEGDGWMQLGKPRDEQHAAEMLAILQGKTHTVITGVCLKWPTGFSAFTESSQVTFKPMDQATIRRYIAGGEPMDKAGAYGIQGDGRQFIERLEGSFTSVMGLPTERLQEALKGIK